jgi:hypothetical protein
MMNKKPPSNYKYKEVKKTIDTGKTIKDVEIISDKLVSKRKSELFKRINPTTVIKLIEECTTKESIYNLADENLENVNENESVFSNKTELTNKTSITAITYATEMLGDLVNFY